MILVIDAHPRAGSFGDALSTAYAEAARATRPGFAFKMHEGGKGWDKLLSGRSGRLIVTMDWPTLAYRWIQGAPGHKAMVKATLGFCGVTPVQLTQLGQVSSSTPEIRAAFLAKVQAEAARDAARCGPRTIS